jgi:hypothetical protein
MKRIKLRNSSSAAATEREKVHNAFRKLLAPIEHTAMEDFEIGNVVPLRSGGPKNDGSRFGFRWRCYLSVV